VPVKRIKIAGRSLMAYLVGPDDSGLC
jgi:hypothetical protein